MLTTAQERKEQLERLVRRSDKESRRRLATYLRRYISPLIVEELFGEGQIGILAETREISRVSVIIADLRGFTPRTMVYEQRGQNLQAVSDLLKSFLKDSLRTVFEYRGVMGELSGDRFMAVFGIPFPEPDDAERALLAAMDIYRSGLRLNDPLLIKRQRDLTFDLGIGISSGGPIWVGDIGSEWRSEWTLIGTTINLASRVEELTKQEEFYSVNGPNILLTQPVVDSLSPELRQGLSLHEFPQRPLRGLGEIEHHIYKITNQEMNQLPQKRMRIDSATVAVVDAIAQSVETIEEREDTFRLGFTMQAIGEAIASSLDLAEILESVLDGVQRFLNATTASILLIEEGTDRLKFQTVRPKANLEALRSLDKQLIVGGDSIVGQVAADGNSLLLSDARNDPRFFSKADQRTGFQTRSVLCTPIHLDEVIIGVIQVIDTQAGKFNEDDLRILEAIAAFAASAIRNTQQYTAISEAETLAAMSVLTSDMAHRIKNDVGMIKVVTERLLSKIANDEELESRFLKSKLEKIITNADNTLNMTDEIRHPFSDLTLGEVNPRDLLEESVTSVISRLSESSKIRIQRNYQEIPPVMTDRARLAAVFEKIIENSVDAMAESDIKLLTLSIDISPTSEELAHISIADTGVGVPEELKGKLFRLMPQRKKEDEKQAFGGWGYGLWSSSMFIRSLGGSISLDQVYSEGTRILIDLPFNPEQ